MLFDKFAIKQETNYFLTSDLSKNSLSTVSEIINDLFFRFLIYLFFGKYPMFTAWLINLWKNV